MTTALGLGVLVLSPLVASQQFGITAVITIAYSLISIVLVPPTMTLWGAHHNMRLRSRTQRWAAELDEMIEAVTAPRGSRRILGEQPAAPVNRVWLPNLL